MTPGTGLALAGIWITVAIVGRQDPFSALLAMSGGVLATLVVMGR